MVSGDHQTMLDDSGDHQLVVVVDSGFHPAVVVLSVVRFGGRVVVVIR